MNRTDQVVRTLRQWGVLQRADWLRQQWVAWKLRHRNQRFRREHPNFPVPPDGLAYDAYGTIDWVQYCASGRQEAERVAAWIQRHVARGGGNVLEWGCGPGRVIRQLRVILGEGWNLTGADYNADSIRWCSENLPGIDFLANDLLPPIARPDATFDAIYALSVVTHLSEAAHDAWRDELRRLLRPDGVVMLTTQGQLYRDRYLFPDEQQQFDSGQLVVRGKIAEGKKWYSAFHPERFVRERLLAGFDILDFQPGTWGSIATQDVWIARAR